MKKTYLILSGLILLAVSCASTDNTGNFDNKSEKRIFYGNKNDELLNRADIVLRCLKQRDFKQLALFVHKKGVTFSPYAFVDKQAVKFTADQLKVLKLKDKFMWGHYDGSGDSIDLSVEDYFKKFVFNQDFTQAQHIGIDKIVKKGNTIPNIDKVFPKAHFVEYHFPGIDPKYEGIDWTSLRLLFEEAEGQMMLVGVVHDAWTI